MKNAFPLKTRNTKCTATALGSQPQMCDLSAEPVENDPIHRPYGDITLQVAGGFQIECGEPMYPKLWRGPGDPPTMGECHTDIRASPNCQLFQWCTSTHITLAHNISSISILGKAIMLIDKYSFNRQGARTIFTTVEYMDVLVVAVEMY